MDKYSLIGYNKTMPKECGTCTKCCEGWLSSNIKGHDMYPGKPCFFVEIGRGCTIYEDRPEDPCKGFLCSWIQIEEMPEEFKPEKSGVIMHWKNQNNVGYYVLTKAPNNPTAEFLSWAIAYCSSKGQNILWYINDKSYWIGSQDFCIEMFKEHIDNV